MKKLVVALLVSALVLSTVGAVNAEQKDPGADRVGVVAVDTILY